MNKDLQSYVKVYENWLEKDKCVEIIDNIKDNQWEQHVFYDTSINSYTKRSGDKELDISYSSSNSLSNQYIMPRIWDVLKTYVTELDFSWYDGWSGYSQVRYNHYKTGRTMALHCDHITTLFDGDKRGIPVLTVLGALNEDYDGGELIMWGDTVIKMKTGDMIVFPSNFLYPHMVKDVTKGERYSFVSWAW